MESITAQTLRDFEVIIVDDESSDRTIEISSQFASRDGRFQVYRNETRLGLVGNWNRSIELSKGTWIKLFFQDDLMAPDCLQRLVSGCLKWGRPFAFCRRHLLFDDQTSEEARDVFLFHEKLLDEVYGSTEFLDARGFVSCYAERTGWNLVGEPTVTLFHRSMTQRLGKFDPRLVQLCDAEYWTRLASNVGVVHIAEKLATFRIHGNSTTAHNFSKRAFRMQTVDPLILTYRILLKPYYRTLRQALYRRRGVRAVWLDFADAVYRAWILPRPSSPTSDSGDRRRELEWENVVGVYAGLQVFRLVGWLLAMTRAVMRRIGFRSHLREVRKL